MLNHRFEKLQYAFVTDYANYWSNLSWINNLLVIMNTSIHKGEKCDLNPKNDPIMC
jgi:hypothetical protein